MVVRGKVPDYVNWYVAAALFTVITTESSNLLFIRAARSLGLGWWCFDCVKCSVSAFHWFNSFLAGMSSLGRNHIWSCAHDFLV